MLGDGRLGEIVATFRSQYGVPAIGAITVVNGLIVEQAVDGLRSIDSTVAVTLADKWHIGSVTKAMTATLAAVLVEQSVLSWDTTPLDVWPEYADSMQAQYRDVTVVELLSHQSGLSTQFDQVPSIELTKDDAPGGVVEKRRLWARELLESTPANSVGDYQYTNSGYIVVGSMLETMTGTPWETLMMDHVIGPLGMLDTGFRSPGTEGQTDQPWGHWEQNGILTTVPPGPDADTQQAIGPAGNIHTTLSDYALFMFAHLEGEQGIPGLVSAETFQYLHEAVGDHSYALGWQVDDRHAWANGPLLFHRGTNLRWVAHAGIIPGLNAGTLVVTNAANAAASEALAELAVLLLNRKRQSLAE
jgi:CubicO group peptidase (beta-lactamase class C family)